MAYIFQQQAHDVSKHLFIDASKVLGKSRMRIVTGDYLPMLFPQIAVNFFIDLGRVMLIIGQLGLFSLFLDQEWFQLTFGSGEMRNTSNNWATLLGTARVDILRAFWVPFFAALAITYTIVTFNMIGEGLRRHYTR